MQNRKFAHYSLHITAYNIEIDNTIQEKRDMRLEVGERKFIIIHCALK